MQILLSRWRRCSWQRQCQLAAIGMITALVIGTLSLQKVEDVDDPSALERPRFYLSKETLTDPLPTELINLHDFEFIINNEVCAGNDIYVLIFVHSSAADFHARNAIRATWGGIRNVTHHQIRTIFLLGSTSSKMQRHIEKENQIHHDIIQGNFFDSYKNLSYKHIMGFKWITSHCNQSKFILKADEDLYLDIFQMVDYLITIYGVSPPRTLLCNVYPYGTPALRQGKWAVSPSEYPYIEYPRYCAGLAYIVTPDVGRDFNAASAHVQFFWIDDVYVTGFLAEALRLRHLSLNFRVTIKLDPIKEWLQSNSSFPAPYLLADIGDDAAWTRLLRILWDKTLSVHNMRL